jgi:hypothetical protein
MGLWQRKRTDEYATEWLADLSNSGETGEIAALRRQTDSIIQSTGLIPAFPVVRKTNLPTDSSARGTETS